MARRLKLLTELSTLALSGALALGACGGEGEGGGEGAQTAAHGSHGAGGEAEGEGAKAGAGGESEGAAPGADPATDDVAYLTQLLFVRGHLKAFYELHKAGAAELAAAHAKHPESELYAGLVPAFAARGQTGFAEELSALSAAHGSSGDIDAAYENLRAGITRVEPATVLKNKILAVARVARIAADEFDVAAEDDGAIGNVKEYQDAYGFLSVSKDLLASAAPANADERAAFAEAIAQLDGVLAQFDGWTPPSTPMKASAIYGAAARLEIAGLGLN